MVEHLSGDLDTARAVHDYEFFLGIFVSPVDGGFLDAVAVAFPQNAFAGDLAVADGHDAAHLLAQGDIMGDDEDGLSVFVEFGKDVKNQVRSRKVDASGRLVGEEELGRIGQGDGNGDSLLFTSGEGAEFIVLVAAHTDHLEEFQRLLALFSCTGDIHGQHDIFQGIEIREEVPGIVLPHEAHRLALVVDELLLGHGEEVFAADHELSGAGAVESSDHVEEGTFAASAVADEGGEFPFADFQVEALQSEDFEFFGLIDFDEALGFDHERVFLCFRWHDYSFFCSASATPLGR